MAVGPGSCLAISDSSPVDLQWRFSCRRQTYPSVEAAKAAGATYFDLKRQHRVSNCRSRHLNHTGTLFRVKENVKLPVNGNAS